jgi:hypothetical protein
LIFVLVLCGLKGNRSKGHVTMHLLVGVALLLAAFAPAIEFFGAVWRSADHRDILDALFSQSLSWRAIASYTACLSGLGLLAYFAFARCVTRREALWWFIGPALVGVTFMMVESRGMSSSPNESPSVASPSKF